MKNLARKRVHKLNKKGAGIVTVIVAIAFVSILCSLVLTTSYMNFKMKNTNAKTKDTFYSAETALDEISVGLQGYVSEAFSSAYMTVLEQYSSSTADTKNTLFENLYYDNLYPYLAADARYTTFDLSKLTCFVTRAWDDTTKTGVIVTSATNSMVTYDKVGIILKDIEVYYRDANGYSTTITTDIKLGSPQIDFGAVSKVPNIKNFVAISDGTITVNTSTGNTTTLTGDVYGSNILATSPSETSKGKVVFSPIEKIIAKNTLEARYSTVTLKVKSADLWASDLVANSSQVTVSNSVYLSDDIELKGNGSNLKISNKLIAYGTELNDSSNSSAILINGTNSTLDMSKADIVTIAGHAYIGTNKIDVNPSATDKADDIYTGESISIKSNQLMYLIPGECIGVYKTGEGDGVTYGTSKYNKNPLTKEEYEVIKTGSYEMVYTGVTPESLGHPLSDYIAYVGGDGGTKPRYETVFVPTNQPGVTMVYFYMTFGSEAKANQYFRDYYSKNADRVQKYVSYYVDKIVMADAASMVRLQLAGNSLLVEPDEDDPTITDIELLPNNIDNASAKLQSSSSIYASEMNALTVKLLTDLSDAGEIKKTDPKAGDIIFENLIDEEFLNTNITEGSTKIFEGEDTRAILVRGSYIYTGDGTEKPTKLIIATGDVTVSANFNGLVFTKGNIIVSDSKKLKADETGVTSALRNSITEADGTEVCVYSFFREGSAIARSSSGMSGSASSLALADLVTYENWKRR